MPMSAKRNLLLGILALASPPGGHYHYHLLKKVPLGAAPAGGREYFDYLTVDSQARRVYASHGTEVKVADADSGAVVGTISGLKQCHGIALVELPMDDVAHASSSQEAAVYK